jgi:hypothetical protein
MVEPSEAGQRVRNGPERGTVERDAATAAPSGFGSFLDDGPTTLVPRPST